MRRTHCVLFLNIEKSRRRSRKQSYTAHDITSHCRYTACGATTRMDWLHFHRLECSLEVLQRYPSAPKPSGPRHSYRWGAAVCYLAACASWSSQWHALQRDVALAKLQSAGMGLVGARMLLSVQRGWQGSAPFTHSRLSAMHIAPTWLSAPEQREAISTQTK